MISLYMVIPSSSGIGTCFARKVEIRKDDYHIINTCMAPNCIVLTNMEYYWSDF